MTRVVLRALPFAAALALASAAWASGTFVEPTTVIAELHGDSTSSGFGWAVSELEDVDGDGALDGIAGEPFTGPSAEGSLRVFSGATGATIYRLDGAGENAQLGYAIADAGDSNGDGVSDIVAGAPNNPGAPAAGYVDLYSGADGALLHRFEASRPGTRFGAAVSGAGDVDRDGHADLLVGEPLSLSRGSQTGRVYVYSGRTYRQIRKLDVGEAGDLFGTAVDWTPDVNGDGRPDHIVGARNAGPTRGGLAYVFSGKNGRRIFTITPPADTAVDFGWFFVAGIGDADRDGTPDVYAADFSDRSLNTPGTGRAGVYSGRDGSELQAWVGSTAGDGLGPGREAGDVDGDGAVDVAIGSYTSSAGAAQAGKIEIFSGRTGELLRRITSTTPNEQLGFDAVGLGDVNGDSKPDLLASAANESTVYIVAG
jgi:hypothetical protein